MNNQELELKVKELLEIENFFDMMIAVKDFEKDYKGSDFYKNTRMPLLEVIKNSKMWYVMSLDNITNYLQKIINNLNLDNISAILDRITDVFQEENAEILEMANLYKDLQQ